MATGYGFKLSSLLFVAAISALTGFLLVRNYWKRYLDDLASSFQKLDGTHLEIKGRVGNGLMHVRFRIDEILDVRLGNESKTSLLHPLLAFANATSLLVQEKNGKTIRFNPKTAIERKLKSIVSFQVKVRQDVG